MSYYCRVVQMDDWTEIMDYENAKLMETVPDEMERQIQSWNSRWRKESLEHYISTGWCFLARMTEVSSEYSKEGKLAGYFLAKPLLFFDGHTQSLWIEHLAFNSLQARDELCELAYKLSREKHFQKVFFPNSQGIQNSVGAFKAENWQPSVLAVKTTKI